MPATRPPAGAKNSPNRPSRGKKKRAEAEPRSRGLAPADLARDAPPAPVLALESAIARDGGAVLRVYRDPLGGRWQIFAALPLDAVEPTPYQRDLSEAHVVRLSERIDQLDRFLDPVIAYRAGEGRYWTPNGHHRIAALRRLEASAVVALVLPDQEIAYKILALNTEKAHNLREKSLEVIRMARTLAELDPRPEQEFAVEFEDPTFLTLGLCYEKRGRFSGGAYQPVLKRIDRFLSGSLSRALAVREQRAGKLLELDDAVSEAVAALKARGLESPYLKAFVVSRINPLAFKRGAAAEFDETVDRMLASAKRFDPAKIKPEQLARAAGAGSESAAEGSP